MIIKEFEKQIELQNEGELTMFFVGCGNAFTKKYFQTNLVIVKGKDHLVVDCGSLFPFVWQTEYKSSLADISNILVTHPHADHIGGMEELMLTGRYVKKQKLNIVITNDFKKKLWNESLRGGCQYSDSGKLTFDDYFAQNKPVQLQKKPFPMYEANVGSLNIKIFRTLHVTTKPGSYKNAQYSVGLIIDNKVLFTADTQFNKPQLDWILENFDIKYIFHDCDLSNSGGSVHTPYKMLCTLPLEVKNKIYLCHYNDQADSVNPESDGFAGFVRKGVYYFINS